ncbi:hypothetical protein ACFY00_26540 [Kitasatospora sp. NPDC001540]|uniref:hypothetical protein n=1 Tax=Kitasatospora sp. NPDC001540 TaxID=3364014 RepID=UPI0036851704
MRSARSALLLGATALVGLGLILLLVSGTAIHGGAALGVLAAGWWGIGLVPVHARNTPPEPRKRQTDRAAPDPAGAGGAPPDG